MRALVFGALALVVGGCADAATKDRVAAAPLAEAAPSAAAVSPAAIAAPIRARAVRIHADWCPSCKILDPKLDAVKARGPIEGLDHVVLDYTKRDVAALYAAADAAGVGTAVRARFGDKIKTGLLLVIDAETGALVSEFTKASTEDEIAAGLIQAAAP